MSRQAAVPVPAQDGRTATENEIPLSTSDCARHIGSAKLPAATDVAGQGQTIDEALTNLAEAVELYLEEVDDPAGHVTATPLVTVFRLPAE